MDCTVQNAFQKKGYILNLIKTYHEDQLGGDQLDQLGGGDQEGCLYKKSI